MSESQIERRTEVAGVTFVASLPAVRHRRTLGVTDDVLAAHELAIACWLAERGARSSASLRFMRKVLGLRASQLARVLGVGPRAIARWESGERPVDPLAAALVAILVREHARGSTDALDTLRALRSPPRLPRRPVRIPAPRSAG